MRAPRIIAMVALGVAVSSPARGELRIIKSDGTEAAPGEATKVFNAQTGGWDVTLHALYAPGDWTSYGVHGDEGEVIDHLVIDVPCWEDQHGNCIPAGSPVVVRVISDGDAGVRTVHVITQTGTAETLLNLVDVREDIGHVEVEAIGVLKAGRDVVGPVLATTRDNPARGITWLEAQRDILGDVSAELGRIQTVLAYGRVGTAERPVTLRAKHDLYQVAAYGGIWADIRTRVNGGQGRMFALGGPSFHGTLDTEALASPWTGWPARISIWGRFEGLINIGRSFDDPEQWMEFDMNGLGGQVIINGDGHADGTWSSPVYLGFEGNPLRFPLPGPAYPQTPAALGGGSVGVAPFLLHREACDPSHGAVVETEGSTTVRLHHYGPVALAGPAPLTIERRPVGGTEFDVVPIEAFAFAVDSGSPNTLVVEGAAGHEGFVGGYAYRLHATADLVSAVTGEPPVGWTAPHVFTLKAGSTCPADRDGSGLVDIGDLLLVLAAWGPCPGCPEDLDGDGVVGFNDLLVVLGSWGPCGGAGARGTGSGFGVQGRGS